MTREHAIAQARAYFDDGGFVADLARRVAIPSTSQDLGAAAGLAEYLEREMVPALEGLGIESKMVANPAGAGPFLIGQRIEDPDLVTVLTYGHGDTVLGQAESWSQGRDPWRLGAEGDRLYGRGTADNKGQHTVNLGALASVLAARGRLGFNIRVLIETGEEIGSPGLREICMAERDDLLAADVFIASDGPRLAPRRPTIFLGARGCEPIEISVSLRDGGHHSGNWGGLLANPAILLSHALASITDARGAILIPEWRPELPDTVRRLLAGLEIPGGGNGPDIDPDWGEPGLSPAERVYGWNSFEILAMTAGTPDNPVNAIPPTATAHCQLRFVVGGDPDGIVPALRRHLDRSGFGAVSVRRGSAGRFTATRLDPDNPWVHWAAASLERTTEEVVAILPNLGGSLPNDIFSDVLGLPTIWVPHSYAGCSQHAPDEHLLASVARQGLEIMAGLFWDLGEENLPSRQ